MANKTWIATDIAQGKLTLIRAGNEIHLERRYKFLGNGGDVLEQVTGGRVLETIPVAEIPTNILNALQELDNWTKMKALEQEGML